MGGVSKSLVLLSLFSLFSFLTLPSTVQARKKDPNDALFPLESHWCLYNRFTRHSLFTFLLRRSWFGQCR